MTAPKVTRDLDAGNAAVHIHQHVHAPRPLLVADDDGARAVLGLAAHKRGTYRSLGVPLIDLPNGRFAVSVAEFERAIGGGAEAPPREPAPPKSSVESIAAEAAARSGLRLVAPRGRGR